MKTVLITGANGQDGTNLIIFLCENISNIKLFCSVKDLSTINSTLKEYIDKYRIFLVKLDLSNDQEIKNVFNNILPDYFINLGGQSSVGKSWDNLEYTFKINTYSIVTILNTIKNSKPKCRFFNAGSSEEFGLVKYTPQDMLHPKNPQSPYATSKTLAHNIIKFFRQTYNIFAIHSIMYNHEGTMRSKNFVTRKITSNIARIKKELEDNKEPQPLELGNLNTKRDFGNSFDYVEAIWLMINNYMPKDYIVSTNESYSLYEFITLAFKCANIPISWHIDIENPLNTKVFYNNKSNYLLLKINKKYYRPTEVENLVGSNLDIKRDLKWKPKTTFKGMIKEMIDNDINLINQKKPY